MQTAVFCSTVFVLCLSASTAAQSSSAVITHAGAVGRWAPMRHYYPVDRPMLVGAEIVIQKNDGVSVAVDISGGTKKGIRDRRSLAVIGATALFVARTKSQVRAIGGVGLALRAENGPFQPLMVRTRFGALIDVTSRMFFRPELLVDVGAGLDRMGLARVRGGFRF